MPVHGYEIRVRGVVGEAVQAAFADMQVVLNPVETIVFGQVRDQAALHGLLDRLQELGLELVEVRRLPGGSDAGSQRSSCPET